MFESLYNLFITMIFPLTEMKNMTFKLEHYNRTRTTIKNKKKTEMWV